MQHFCIGIAREDRMLAVFVSPNEAGFGVVAVASPLGKSAVDRLSPMQVAEKVYDDHSHEIIGQYKSLRRAISSAEKFALRWLKSGKVSGKCACGPIRKRRAA